MAEREDLVNQVLFFIWHNPCNSKDNKAGILNILQ
jgi:hypothetical protein